MPSAILLGIPQPNCYGNSFRDSSTNFFRNSYSNFLDVPLGIATVNSLRTLSAIFLRLQASAIYSGISPIVFFKIISILFQKLLRQLLKDCLQYLVTFLRIPPEVLSGTCFMNSPTCF